MERLPAKGNAPPVQAKQATQSSSRRSAFPTTALCQKVVKEADGFIEVQSHLSNVPTGRVIRGHKVPLSLWDEVATTLADYLADKAQQKRPRFGFNVSDIVVKSPLVVEGGRQIYRASGHLDPNSCSVWVSIFSMNDFGKIIAHHAECIVDLEETKNAPITARTSLSSPATSSKRRSSPTVARSAKSPASEVSDVSKAMAALSIISKEIGVRIGEMSADSAFDDLGLDSLVSVTITNCLREELGLEVDSSLFATCPTVKQLVELIDGANGRQMQVPTATISSSATPVSSISTSSSTASRSGSDGGSPTSSAPTSVASSEQGDDCKEEGPDTAISMADQIRSLIAEEAGVEEIKGSTTLTELGLDSLLVFSLTNRLREYLDKKDIPPTIFAGSSTCDEVISALGIHPEHFPASAASGFSSKRFSRLY